MRKIALVFTLALLIPISGCKLVTAAPTPGVAQFYSQSALVLNDFSGVLQQAQQIFTTAHAIGTVNDADYRNGQRVIAQIAQEGDSVTALVKAGGDQATIRTQIAALITQVGNMPSAFGIKNPATQAEFTALSTAMQNILQSVSILITGGK